MSDAPRIRLDEYLEMAADGVLAELDAKVELINGRLIDKTVPSPLHAEVVSRFFGFDYPSAHRERFKLWVGNPITFPAFDSCPEPDIAWVPRANYYLRYPCADETKLIVEVADETLEFDSGEKAELYAAARIKDYWVVSLRQRLVHVFRQPQAGTYAAHTTAGFGEELQPLAFPQFSLSVSELLGP